LLRNIALIALGVIAFAVIALYAVSEWQLRAQREARRPALRVTPAASMAVRTCFAP
jgi:hypothetical protein